MASQDNVTLVSGFWDITSPYLLDQYKSWFRSTMKINQRMYFFCAKDTIPYIRECRGNLETIFVEFDLDDFYAKTVYEMLENHPEKIQSVQYKIQPLLEKFHLVKKARDMDGENQSTYYIWYNADFVPFRNEHPPSKRLNIYKNTMLFNTMMGYSEYYPENSEMLVDGNAFIIHKDLVDVMFTLYYNFVRWNYVDLRKMVGRSDDILISSLLTKHPNVFCRMSVGPGENLIMAYEMS